MRAPAATVSEPAFRSPVTTPVGDNWLVLRINYGDTPDTLTAQRFEAAVRTFRPSRPGEPAADPYHPDRIAALYVDYRFSGIITSFQAYNLILPHS